MMLARKLSVDVQRGLELLRSEVPGRVCEQLPRFTAPSIHDVIPMGGGQFSVMVNDVANNTVYVYGPYTSEDLNPSFTTRLRLRTMAAFN